MERRGFIAAVVAAVAYLCGFKQEEKEHPDEWWFDELHQDRPVRATFGTVVEDNLYGDPITRDFRNVADLREFMRGSPVLCVFCLSQPLHDSPLKLHPDCQFHPMRFFINWSDDDTA